MANGIHEANEFWFVKETRSVSYCRVYYIHSGKVTYRDESTVKQLRNGYVYVFPSTKPYELEQDEKEPLSCLYLHVSIMPYLCSQLLELPVEAESFLYYLLHSLEVWMKDEERRFRITPITEDLTSAFVSYLNSMQLLDTVPDKLADTLVFIAEHVREKITVDMLSELCGYQKQYYIRLFYTHLGVTPHQYLIHYRMKLALSMLMENTSISETADRVGYPELRNFSRAFKAYYGYSPNQVKKNLFTDR